MTPRRLLAPICWLRGHRNAMWALPEDEYGLYAFSRLYCSRCERTEVWRQGFGPKENR